MDDIHPRPPTQCLRHSVLCAGLPRSASTWAFNIAAALAKLDGRWTQVAMLYSDDGLDEAVSERMVEGGFVLIKAHAPSPRLRCAVAGSGAPVLLTVRDPRDSAASLMQQFGFGFPEAVRAISSSASALLRLMPVCAPLVLRYEDGFASGPGGVALIADFLGIPAPKTRQERLAREMSREALERLVAETAFTDAPGGSLPLPASHPETQWHPNHIGDGLVGKYRDALTPAQVAVLEYETGSFLRHFGYALSAAPARLAPGARVAFSQDAAGASYLADGFSRIEGWGVWTDSEAASLELPLERPAATWVFLELDCLLAPAFGAVPGSRAEIWVNGRRRAVVAGVEAGIGPEPFRIVLWLQDGSVAGADRLQIELRVSGMRSPRELGHSDDGRRLGIGLRTVTLDHD